MLAIFLFSLIVLPIFYLYGKALIHLIRLWSGDDADPPGFVWTALVGLAVVTFLAVLLSLFMPLSAGALAMVTGGALAIFAWQARAGRLRINLASMRLRLPMLIWILAALVLVSLAEQATRQPTNPDSGIYHAQTIRWAETYPAVPGLGNLHGRLAFNSSWLAVQALFSFAFLGLQSFRMLPVVLAALALADWLRGAAGWLRGDASLANILKTLLTPVFFFVLASEISSPGTDLPVLLLTWFLAAAWLERPAWAGRRTGVYAFTVAILALYAVTIKLSAAPLLVFAGLAAAGALRRPAALAKLALVAGLFLLPWFARSVIQSGYLVYPVSAVDLFDPDWKVPAEAARAEHDAIVAFARLPSLERSEVLAMPRQVWMRQWFTNLTANRRLVLVIAALSPLLLAGLAVADRLLRAHTWDARLLQAYLAMLIGGAYWAVTAPDFRFGYGFLAPLALLPLLIPIAWVSRAAARLARFVPYLVVAGLIAYQGFFFVRSFERLTIAQRVWMPLDYRALPTEPCPLKNRRVMCAAPISYNECWYEPFPCIPFERPEVELRGSDWRDGFRYTGRQR
jgi:hypothetical protein